MENQSLSMLNELASRLVKDEAFRRQILEQPEIALAEAGFSPETLELDTPDVVGYRGCEFTCQDTCSYSCSVTG